MMNKELNPRLVTSTILNEKIITTKVPGRLLKILNDNIQTKMSNILLSSRLANKSLRKKLILSK